MLEDVIKKEFNYAFNPKDLWEKAKDKKITKYNMSDVKHWVYNPCWTHPKNDDWPTSIHQALTQPKKFPDHIKRIKKADISHALIVVEDEFDKFGGVLDGKQKSS